jgi:arabinan endo-1,5-alpha-L-arabinosidase
LRRLLALALLLTLTACTAQPLRADLAGDFAVHDPALVVGENGEPWFVYSTGGAAAHGAIQVRRSDDGVTWQYAGVVWKERPAWIESKVGPLWAPELIQHDGTWYMYYAASTFGSNHSAIGLATNTTLDPADADYEWVDQGPVLESETSDDFNAIDPGIVVDGDGVPWMAFGSFWSGIRMVQLDWPSGLRADDAEPLRLADRRTPPNAIEAPTIVEHDGDYFLFVSFDSCCQGLNSTYRVAVGRASDVTGPYVDRDGIPLLSGGGTVLLATDGDRIGPGGESASNSYLGYHFYDGTAAGAPRLAISRIDWDAEGWPLVG